LKLESAVITKPKRFPTGIPVSAAAFPLSTGFTLGSRLLPAVLYEKLIEIIWPGGGNFTLKSYHLVGNGVAKDAFDMHRLVQFPSKKFLELHGELVQWQERYIGILDEAFPTGEHANWPVPQKVAFRRDHDGKERKDILPIYNLINLRSFPPKLSFK
jgi:hypothetical protein